MKELTAIKDIAERLELLDDEAFNRAQKHATAGVKIERRERDYLAEAKDMYDDALVRIVRQHCIDKINQERGVVSGAPTAAVPAMPPSQPFPGGPR